MKKDLRLSYIEQSRNTGNEYGKEKSRRINY